MEFIGFLWELGILYILCWLIIHVMVWHFIVFFVLELDCRIWFRHAVIAHFFGRLGQLRHLIVSFFCSLMQQYYNFKIKNCCRSWKLRRLRLMLSRTDFVSWKINNSHMRGPCLWSIVHGKRYYDFYYPVAFLLFFLIKVGYFQVLIDLFSKIHIYCCTSFVCSL